MPVLDERNLVCLTGMPRSGTTWLQLMLARHPIVETTRETHLFDHYLGSLLNAYGREEVFGRLDGLSPDFDRSAYLRELVRPFCMAVLCRAFEGKPGAERYLEKTPGSILRARDLVALFPEVRIIYIVRDPRAVVASYQAAASEAWGGWAKRTPTEIAASWVNYNLAWESAIGYSECLISVRYEDLLRNGAEELKRLFAFMDIPTSGIEVDSMVEDFRITNAKNVTGFSELVKERPNFVRRGEAESWRTELDESTAETVSKICHYHMRAWGYD